MRYKAVFLDMDGTLLNSKKEISEYTCNTINKISKDIPIIITSARGFKTIEPYIKKLNIFNKNNFTIAFNGSLVLANDESIKYSNNIFNSEEKMLIKEYIKENKLLEWILYTYSDRVNKNDLEDYENFIDKNNIYKVVCIAEENKIKKLKVMMNDILKSKFEITSSELNRIEFVKKGITKKEAIKKILDIIKATEKEIIAIGDGENDIEMIETAGLGIAMGNATDTVKCKADMIADINDNDGVAKILEEILNLS